MGVLATLLMHMIAQHNNIIMFCIVAMCWSLICLVDFFMSVLLEPSPAKAASSLVAKYS